MQTASAARAGIQVLLRELTEEILCALGRLSPRLRGKTVKPTGRRDKPKVTAEQLIRTYKKETQRQKRLVKMARVTENRLVFIANALKRLLADEAFHHLVRAEHLDTMPEYLAAVLRRAA